MARLTNLTGRGLETQAQLRIVLMALIIEKGYEHVSIKDITERAGIDRSTFYLHFKDKDDLFGKSQRWMVDELMELRSQATGPFPGIAIVFEHMAANKDLYRAIYRYEGSSSSGHTLQDYIASSMIPVLETILPEHGIKDTEGKLEPIARYLAGALRGLSRWWLESGSAMGPGEMSSLFLTLSTRGLESMKEI